jgi:hypothetical protein
MLPDEILWPNVTPEQMAVRAEWSTYLQNTDLGYEAVQEWEGHLRDAIEAAAQESLAALDFQADSASWGVEIRQMGSNAQDFHGVFLWIGEVFLGGLVGAALSRPLASFYGNLERQMSAIRRRLGDEEVVVGLTYHRDTLTALCQEHVRWIHGDNAQPIEVVEVDKRDGQSEPKTESNQSFIISLKSEAHMYKYMVTPQRRLQSLTKDGVDQPTPDLISHELGVGEETQEESEQDLFSILCSSAPRNGSQNIAMIAFIFPLPFALGIPHHSTVMMMGDEVLEALADRQWFVTEDGPELPDFGSRIGVSIRVWRPRKKEILINSLVHDMNLVFGELTDDDDAGSFEFSSEDTAGTVLEASTVLFLADEDEDDSAALSRAFDRCIDKIGLFLRAFRIAIDDPRIYPMGRLSLLPSAPFVVRYGDDLENRHIGLFMVNMGESLPVLNVEEVPPELARQALERVRRSNHQFPLSAVEDAFARAKRSFFVESDYAATTVFAHTAIEVFCNGLLSLLMWESGGLRSENIAILTTQGLETRLRRHYAPMLGGNWDFKSDASPIHAHDEVAQARHRYLHAGIEPSMQDADLALEAFSVVTEFAKDRLVARMYDFPRTTLLILGEPGLRRKNAWTRRFQKLVDEIVGEDDWLISFSDWIGNLQATN